MVNRLINEHYFSDETISSIIGTGPIKKTAGRYSLRQENDVIKKLISCLIENKPLQYKNLKNDIKSYKKVIYRLDPKCIEKRLLTEYLSCLNHPLGAMASLSKTSEIMATCIYNLAPRERGYLEKYYVTKNFDILINRIRKLKSYS